MSGVKVMVEIQEKTSLVYFWRVYNEDFDPLVKIGITTNWPNRLASLLAHANSSRNHWPDWLQVGCIEGYSLAGLIEGGRETEKYLHKKFAKYSIGFEWFDYNDECADMIDELLDERCLCCI
jgi:hypothetical protein